MRSAVTPQVAAPSAEVAANRSVIARIRALDDRALRQIAVSGDDLERAAAVHVLWLRGAREDVEALVAEFAEAGMTLVFASHNLGQVKRLATRVVYMEQGRILADLPVQAFFEGPLEQTSREAEQFVRGETG